MLLGQVAITCRFQAKLCYVDSNAAELETRKLGGPYLMGRGVNHTF